MVGDVKLVIKDTASHKDTPSDNAGSDRYPTYKIARSLNFRKKARQEDRRRQKKYKKSRNEEQKRSLFVIVILFAARLLAQPAT